MRKNFLFIIASFLIMASLYAAFEMLVPARTLSSNTEIEIPKGATFKQTVDILAGKNLIRDRKIFLLLGRLAGADRKIRAGFYSIWSNMSPWDIFKIIRKGKIIEYEVKILEGDSLPEIAEELSRAGVASYDEVMAISKDPEFLSSHNIEAPSIEGFVFPDTYMIPKGVEATDALAVMIDRMREKYSGRLVEKTEKTGMTETEVLTLASIIEKEAIVDSERPLISAVYHNRLKKNMPLQADPTSIYGIKSSKEKITKADLQRKTPYNTYTIKGLPPGPIASPGLKSIVAALNPADVPYLYFVSNNDGTHIFSVTLSQHAEAVRAYRDKKKMESEG